MDYIFDWARDVYRQSILNELNVLTGGEMLFTDPDIFSTIEGRQSRFSSEWPNLSQGIGDDNGEETLDERKVPSSSLIDSRESIGIVKEAFTIESRFLSIHINEEDVENFLLSFPTVEASNSVARTMIQCWNCSWRTTAEALSGLEVLWTKFGPREHNNNAPNEIYHVKVFILMHVSVNWVPVRQLTYLAISESALQVLISKAGLQIASSGAQTRFRNAPFIERSEIEGFVASVMEQSIVDNLTAAVSMLCLSSTCHRQAGRIPRKWLLKRSNKYFAGFSLDRLPSVLELVESIFESHRIGRRDPTDPYIRFSQDQTIQTIHSREFCMWPGLDPICQDTNGCALIDGLNLQTGSARYCLYILNRHDFDPLDTPDIVESLAEGGLYYSTLQLGPNLRPGQYFQYLNRSMTSSRLWREVDSLDPLKNWIEGLKQSRLVGEAGGTFDSPILLSPDEEVMDDDYMDDD